MDTPEPNSLIGKALSHFTIVAKIGQGGMGEVYLATDNELGRKVAVKVLPADIADDSQMLGRLRREARSLAALDHPNIVPVYSFESDGDLRFLTMAFIDGRPLEELIPDDGMKLDDLLEIAIPLADALRAAHEHGIIHRDLKPANVMVDREGRPRVLDFGLAKQHLAAAAEDAELTTLEATEMTSAGTILGTFPYMSPEQAEAKPVDARSDLFSFGIMLYEMACGRRPFEGDTGLAVLSAILQVRQQPLNEIRPELPERLEAIVAQCLEKDPDHRYPTADALRDDLAQLRDEITVGRSASRGSAVATTAPPLEGRPSVVGRIVDRSVIRAAAVVMVAVAVGMGVWKLRPAGEVEQRTVAVLPFVNDTGDVETEYLCEGVVETLIHQLSGSPSLRVAPLSAGLTVRGRNLDPLDAGRQLGVEMVVTGSLEIDGERLRIAAELLDVATGASLWSDISDRPMSDLLDIQEQIADAVLEAGLPGGGPDADGDDLVRPPTTSGEAYDLFLQARHLQRLATEDDYLEALELLRRATVRDPAFAQAHVTMAGIHAAMAIDGYQRPTDAWAQANRSLRRAHALDPDQADAFALRHGMAFFFDWDWEGAARERRLAMRLPVGDFDPDLLRTFSLELLALGRPEDAVAMARRSRELDPLSIGLAMLEADYLVRAGQLEAAIAVYERTIEVEPDNPEQYFGLAEVYAIQGRWDEAIEARRLAHTVAGDDQIGGLFASARGEEGYREADRAWVAAQLVWLEARASWGYVSPLDFARAHAQMGDAETAFDHLDEAFEDRAPGLVFLNVDRVWDGLRDDPRFEEAVRRVGLPQRDSVS